MPIDRAAAFQLCLLVLAVPAQYIISNYVLPSTQESRSGALKNLVNKAVEFQRDYLTVQSWRKWCLAMVQRATNQNAIPPDDNNDPLGESPALEVIEFRDPKGYFSGSPRPRSPRPSSVKYRIGQVIKHKRWGYRGIIIGWDPTAKAPAHWLQQMHPPDKPHWRHQPNYAILVDTRDRLEPQTTYVPEENIEIVTNTKVLHPEVDDFFEMFDGAQYLPRPWLRVIYPHD